VGFEVYINMTSEPAGSVLRVKVCDVCSLYKHVASH
jgi:hypothetical protein